MAEKKFEEYWKSRVKDKEFQSNLNTLVKDFVDEALDKPIDFYIDIASEVIEKADHGRVREIAAALTKGLINDHTPLVVEHLREENIPGAERMTKETIDVWKAYIGQPVNLPPETVRKILNQPAIRELFISVIHDAIVGFNKKVNPLSGVMGALGMEKQIREFIIPFMDSVMDIASNFIIDEKNKSMFQDFGVKLFEIAIHEKPADYMDMPLTDMSSKLADALHQNIKDEKTMESGKSSALAYLQKMKKEFAGQTVRDYMKKHEIPSPVRDLEQWELDLITDNLTGPAITSFMEKEFLAFQNA